jgi:hypothetical protein
MYFRHFMGFAWQSQEDAMACISYKSKFSSPDGSVHISGIVALGCPNLPVASAGLTFRVCR